MKKNGFTLTEILAVVVILAILIGISIPIYNNMQNSTIEKEYDSKVAYIENKVLEYAEANNISSGEIITVGRLINQGYITADKYIEDFPYIDNPKNKGENLACRIVKISHDNYEYSAKLSEESDCELINREAAIEDLGIQAYAVERNANGKYEVVSNIEIDKTKYNEFEWTNKSVVVIVNPKESYEEITISSNVSKKIDNYIRTLNKGEEIPSNLDNTNIELLIGQGTITHELTITARRKVEEKEEVKTARIIVKIDKEKPTINTSTSDRWSNVGKDSTIYVSDGSGSGPSCVFVRETNEKPVATACGGSGSYTATNGVAKLSRLEEGTYYIWAMDKAGNMTDASAQLLIQNIDSDGPSCDYQGEKKVWSKEDVTVKFGCRDDGVGCKTTSSGKIETFTTSDGNGQVSIEDYDIEDNLGNKVTCSGTANVYIDKVNPVLKSLSVTSQDSRYNTSTVNVSVTAEDTHSGIASICFNTSSSTNGCKWINITPTDSSKNQGPNKVVQSSTVNLGSYNGSKYRIYAHVRDRVGNENVLSSTNEYQVYQQCSQKSFIKTECTTCSRKCTLNGQKGKQDCTDYYNDIYLGVACNKTRKDLVCNDVECCSRVNHTSWSACSKACEGSQSRQAYSYYDSSIRCPSSDETQACGPQNCCDNPVRGSEKSSTYSSCPSCGSGTYSVTYYRHSPYDSSIACSDETINNISCNKPACCSDVRYGKWTSCDCEGKQTRKAYSNYNDKRCKKKQIIADGGNLKKLSQNCTKPSSCNSSSSSSGGSNCVAVTHDVCAQGTCWDGAGCSQGCCCNGSNQTVTDVECD